MSNPVDSMPARPGFSPLGLGLFALYLVFYGGFIYLCSFRLDWMAMKGLMGVNYATLYGFGLIILAFILALFYMLAARHDHGDSAS
jgi:uncharacterized membrane protein (DUF485 family)